MTTFVWMTCWLAGWQIWLPPIKLPKASLPSEHWLMEGRNAVWLLALEGERLHRIMKVAALFGEDVWSVSVEFASRCSRPISLSEHWLYLPSVNPYWIPTRTGKWPIGCFPVCYISWQFKAPQATNFKYRREKLLKSFHHICYESTRKETTSLKWRFEKTISK